MPTHSSESLTESHLANRAIVATSQATVHANPALISVRIHADKPAIESLLQRVEILRLSMALTLLRARIALRQASTFIDASAVRSGKPAVVATDRFDGVPASVAKLLGQVIRACVDIVGDAVGALAVRVV